MQKVIERTYFSKTTEQEEEIEKIEEIEEWLHNDPVKEETVDDAFLNISDFWSWKEGF